MAIAESTFIVTQRSAKLTLFTAIVWCKQKRFSERLLTECVLGFTFYFMSDLSRWNSISMRAGTRGCSPMYPRCLQDHLVQNESSICWLRERKKEREGEKLKEISKISIGMQLTRMVQENHCRSKTYPACWFCFLIWGLCYLA